LAEVEEGKKRLEAERAGMESKMVSYQARYDEVLSEQVSLDLHL